MYATLQQIKVKHPSGIALSRSIKDGYGRRIPTEYLIRIDGSNRWLRVYMLYVSNQVTYYVSTSNNNFIVVNHQDLNT